MESFVIFKDIVPDELPGKLVERSGIDLRSVSADVFTALVSVKAEKIVGTGDLSGITSVDPLLMRVKYGIDPTGSEIHLGHLMPMMLSKLFARRGAKVDIVVGDFTARVGDPSGRDTARSVLTRDDIEQNLISYRAQMEPYIGLSRFEAEGTVRFLRNSEWIENEYPIGVLLGILQKISLGSITQREDLRKRIESGKAVSFAEALYPILMGLDSVYLNATIEIGGKDQELNFWLCRDVQEACGMKPESALCTAILEGTSGDGRKMSKSFGNYIPVSAEPERVFGLTMSVPDSHVVPWFKAFADILPEDIPALEKAVADKPMDMKRALGTYLVAMGHGLAAGLIENENFIKKFSNREISDDAYKTVSLQSDEMPIVDALQLAQSDWSKTHIRRLLEDSAVKNMDSNDVLSNDALVQKGMRIKVGKLGFFKFD